MDISRILEYRTLSFVLTMIYWGKIPLGIF